MNKVVNVKG